MHMYDLHIIIAVRCTLHWCVIPVILKCEHPKLLLMWKGRRSIWIHKTLNDHSMVCWQLNLRTDLFCTHTEHCYAIIRKTGSKSNGGKKKVPLNGDVNFRWCYFHHFGKYNLHIVWSIFSELLTYGTMHSCWDFQTKFTLRIGVGTNRCLHQNAGQMTKCAGVKLESQFK